jgi:hypothetical protein
MAPGGENAPNRPLCRRATGLAATRRRCRRPAAWRDRP